MVFDHVWFRRHQRSLLLALNTPGLGSELRAALGISLTGPLIDVRPHAYVVADGARRIAEFRTRPDFARRLQQVGRPLWRLAHWFDLRIANRFAPALNLGFDTLTAYPQPFVATTACDGYVGRIGVDETFSTIVAGAGSGGLDDAGANIFIFLRSNGTTDHYDQLRRGFTLFDTSAIGAGRTVTAATLSLWGIGKDSGLGTTSLAIVASNPAENVFLQDGDFQTMGSVLFGSATYDGFDAGNTAYTDVTLNASGLAAVSLTGVTKLGQKLEWDRAASFTGTWSGVTSTYFQFDMADNASGQSRAPKLVVTFTLPTQFNLVRP